ncbi:Oidioi.mRNA.OKI2018_I69.chr2.g8387.t1.cds [Oikopleura dioica]|uniref:Oidioi.mRNA.OKI2018_I69.chr2.g8387.t1.cds n=1 Tax=Oikopleura dioica TaxID=34765 RepID=A0ABN7TF91_OIKDI|nr:Oidioi.mRNA.OKI2018_I69.chr2.g8387.t1.cds [Oikopleura dioica]
MSRIIGRTLRIRQIFLKELRQNINQRRNLGLAANIGEFGERDAFITEGLPSRDVQVEEFAAYVVKTQTDNVGIAFPATLQGGAYGFGKVGRLDQSMIVVPSFRTLPDGKLLQSPKEAKYIYKMKIIFASPNYPLYFAVPIEFGFNQNTLFHNHI